MVDGFTCQIGDLYLVLWDPRLVSPAWLGYLEDFATRHRDIAAAQSACARKADFKAKLKLDLEEHGAWAQTGARKSNCSRVPCEPTGPARGRNGQMGGHLER